MSLVTRGIGHNPKLVSGGLGGLLVTLQDSGLDGGQGGEYQSIEPVFTVKRGGKSTDKTLAYIKTDDRSVAVRDRQYPDKVTRQFLKSIPRFNDKVKTIQKELNVSQSEAVDRLKERVNKELKARESWQQRVFQSADELIEILLLADVL